MATRKQSFKDPKNAAEYQEQHVSRREADASTRRNSTGKVPGNTMGSPSSFKVFNESSNSTDDRLGFINYDELVTERVRVPFVVNPLGVELALKFDGATAAQPDNANPASVELAQWFSGFNTSVPGVLSLDVDYSPVTGGENNITSDIFLSKWIDIRQLDNMVKNWQPGDPCMIELGLMIVRAQMAHIRRAIEVMRDVYQDSKNLYYSPVALLHAMGFYASEAEVRTMFESFWRYYNQTLVGTLSNVKWMAGSPGHNRWAALMRDVYKDTPAKTRYTQTMLFRPARTYYLTTEEDGWHLKALQPISYYFAADASRTPEDREANPLQGFRTFMVHTYQLIRALFYDDSTQDMLATLNAISIRGKTGGNIGDVEELKFERIGFESDSEFALTFDMQMLVAIQNATICRGAVRSDITIDPTSGNIGQTIHCASNSEFLPMARVAKLLNMPTFAPTQSDFFNATQWTIIAANPSHNSVDVNYADFCDPDVGYASGTFSTDYISDANMVVKRRSEALQNVPGDPGAFTDRVYPLACILPDATTYDLNDMAESLTRVMCAMQFAFAPTIYVGTDPDPGNERLRIAGTFTQTEVVFVCDSPTLSAMHAQWHRNFWGYPSHIEGAIGTPTFDIQSLTERDPLS